jgi:iron complex outermembrane receptor protein
VRVSAGALRVIAFVAPVLALAGTATRAQETPPQTTHPQSLKTLTLEELMSIDVTSPGRRTERLMETAGAVSVITSEDIRRSGVATLPDALRLGGGLTVARFNNGSWAVTARGFANNVVNKMLVLIDGRSVYTQLFGGTFWDMQDMVLADIDRIEIIRGPAGTLWGSNAVNGVINIITKPAAETRGGFLRVTTGTRELGTGAVRYGGRIGAGALRVYAKTGYRGSPDLSTGGDAHQDFRHHQAGFRADWGTRETSTLALHGDVSYGRMGLNDRPDLDFWTGNLFGAWEHPVGGQDSIRVQAYVDRMHRQVPLQSWEDRTTYDIEAQHTALLAGRHRLVWGGGYRLSRDQTRETPLLSFDPDRRNIFTWNLFAEDEYEVRRGKVFLALGSKFEHTTFTGWETQPNVRVRLRLDDRRTLWAALSRAVRTPTRFDQDLRIMAGDLVAIRGDRGFVSEKLIAYEGGYRQQIGPRLSFGSSLFVNEYDDLRSQEPTPPSGVPVVLMNRLNATARGFEVGGSLQAHPRWLLRAGYTFLDLDRSLDPDSLDPTGGAAEGNDPRHQFSLRSFLTLGEGIEVDAFLRGIGSLPSPSVPAYAELDLRIGWRTDRLGVSVIGRDLLHDRHPEFGPALPARHEFPREVALRADVRF